jgi:hypothetical protein
MTKIQSFIFQIKMQLDLAIRWVAIRLQQLLLICDMLDIASFSTAKTVFQKHPPLIALTLSLFAYLHF